MNRVRCHWQSKVATNRSWGRVDRASCPNQVSNNSDCFGGLPNHDESSAGRYVRHKLLEERFSLVHLVELLSPNRGDQD